jgi:hypothetical protein
MTDPRESKNWLFGGRGEGGYDILELSDRANQLAKAHTKILCVTRDAEEVPLPPNERYQRGFAHSRMWTDYAGGHSGVCLIFDRSKLDDAIRTVLAPREVHAGAVTYSEWNPELGEAFTIEFETLQTLAVDRALLAHIQTYRRELLFHKNLDWASELEYRWVVFGDSPTPEFVPFGDALEGLCVGVNFPSADEQTLWYLATRYEISTIPRLTWFNGRVGLQHLLEPGSPPSGAIHIDTVVWGGPRTRELEID